MTPGFAAAIVHGDDTKEAGVAQLVVRGDEIQRLRLTKAWSQSDLAKRAGLRQATISNVERNHVARYSTIVALAQTLGVEVTEITKVVIPWTP